MSDANERWLAENIGDSGAKTIIELRALLTAERAKAAAKLARLISAASDFEGSLKDDCDGTERDTLIATINDMSDGAALAAAIEAVLYWHEYAGSGPIEVLRRAWHATGPAIAAMPHADRHAALLEQIARDTAEIRRLANGGEKRP